MIHTKLLLSIVPKRRYTGTYDPQRFVLFHVFLRSKGIFAKRPGTACA